MRSDERTDAPGAPGFRISDLHAFLAVDPKDNSEGVVGFLNPQTGVMEAMIGADQERIEGLRPIAEGIAEATGLPIKLVRFSERTELEELGAQ